MQSVLCTVTQFTVISGHHWFLFSLYFSLDSYSAAGSEGSISTSVASLPPQPSGSSAPSSPGSRRSVSTLKKWLTNPVRKLSAGSSAKGDRQVRKIEGKPPPLPCHSQSQELGSRPMLDEILTVLPVTHREPVRNRCQNSCDVLFPVLSQKGIKQDMHAGFSVQVLLYTFRDEPPLK